MTDYMQQKQTVWLKYRDLWTPVKYGLSSEDDIVSFKVRVDHYQEARLLHDYIRDDVLMNYDHPEAIRFTSGTQSIVAELYAVGTHSEFDSWVVTIEVQVLMSY